MDLEGLKTFCSKSDVKNGITQPFSTGDFTFATDGHILVRVPRLTDVPEIAAAPNDHVTTGHVGQAFSKEPITWVSPPKVEYKPETWRRV